MMDEGLGMGRMMWPKQRNFAAQVGIGSSCELLGWCWFLQLCCSCCSRSPASGITCPLSAARAWGEGRFPPFGLLLPTLPYSVLFTTFAQHSFFSSMPSQNAEVILRAFALANKIWFLYSSESSNNAVPLSDLGITQCDRLCWAARLSPGSAETDSRDHCL